MKPRVTFFLAVLLALAATRANATPNFIVPDLQRTSGVPQRLTTQDFNNDGHNDVVVTNLRSDNSSGSVDLFLGDGAGHLGAAISTPLEGALQAAPGDFNGDGNQDLAVLTRTSASGGPIVILLGDGAGGFTRSATQLSGGRGNIAVGDVTGEGKPDVVFISNDDSAQIKIFRGKGNGNFATPQTLSRGFGAADFRLADVNGDGKLDIVGVGPLYTMLNLGNGRFGPQMVQPQPLGGQELALEDFNGDKILDVATTGPYGDVHVGLGKGDGSFTPVHNYPFISYFGLSIAAGDWTGDGKVDLVISEAYGQSSNLIALLEGGGDGSFGRVTYWVTGYGDPTPVQLNNDGKVDLVALSFFSETGGVCATLSNGHGGFKAPQNGEGAEVGSLARGDVNGDGKLDFVIVAQFSKSDTKSVAKTFTFINQGNGVFAPPVVSTVKTIGALDRPSDPHLVDIDNDGHLDLITGFEHNGKQRGNVWVLLGDGAGGFSHLRLYDTADGTASNQSIAVADVTGDGILDIIGRTNDQISVLPGESDGTFGAPIVSGKSGAQRKTLVGDVTGDNIPDAVVLLRKGGSFTGAGQLALERGDGAGHFTLIETMNARGEPTDAVLTDLNGDHRPDVAFSTTPDFNGNGGGLRVALNSGGKFSAPTLYDTPPFPTVHLAAEDFDHDGDIDLLGDAVNGLALAVNNGHGKFSGLVEMVSTNPYDSVAGDFTGDGKPDLITINPTTKSLFALYRNATP